MTTTTDMREWTLAVVGCGTVGHWGSLDLMSSGAADRLTGATFIDRALIRERNAITCPGYAGHADRPKSERLEELARRLIRGQTRTRSVICGVDRIDWGDVLPAGGADGRRANIVLVGLDDWGARLTVAEDLRRHAAGAGIEVVSIQIGLDKGQAQVCVYGSRHADPCPACWLPSLPGKQPCVVFTSDNALLRGDLHREAREAARLVRRIVTDLLRGSEAWTNTKTNLTAGGRVRGGFERLTRERCRMMPGCHGPHFARGPMRWSEILGLAAAGAAPAAAVIGAEGEWT